MTTYVITLYQPRIHSKGAGMELWDTEFLFTSVPRFSGEFAEKGAKLQLKLPAK